MISINKYGQNVDLSKVVEVNGKKTFSLDGIDLNKTLTIKVPSDVKFVSSLAEEDLKIEFKDKDGNILELILKNMANLLAQNDGDKLIEILRENTDEVLASITDFASALEAAAAGPAAGNNGNSDNTRSNNSENEGLGFENRTYANDRIDVALAENQQISPFNGIIGVNNAPIITAISDVIVDEDDSVAISFSTTDLNNDTLTTTAIATNGTVIINGNVITYTPNENFNGNDVITLSVNDGTVITTQTINVTVNPVNDAPTIEVQENSLLENTIIEGQLIASDIDTDLANLTFSTTETIDGFVLNADGSYIFDANNYDYLAEGELLELSIPIVVTDDFNASTNSVLNIKINGENDAPTVSVTTVSLIDRTESDFTVNSYYVLTEKEVYDLMGVSDVDSKDGLSLSLVADSGVFELDGKNVNSENNGIIQLTAEDIEDFGLTGKANVGDFFVFSTEFESMSKTDVTKITFDVKAFDGTTYSNAVSVNMDVNGENDAPTVSVTTVSLIDRTESDFTVNSYYVLTEKEVYDLMGVSDVDSKDGLSLSLVADSGVFELDGKNVNSENNGIIQLTAEDIEDFGLTGKANVGDFFVFSTEFESMSKTDVTKITFDVKAFDGTTYSNAVSVNMDVNGENDAPTVSVTTVSLIDRTESDFTVNSYYVLTEKEVYDLMGVSDVDSKDGLSLSLVADSGVFELDGKNVNSENNGIIQLTAEDIEDFGLTGKANVGDFFVFSTEFESMSKTDVTKITFDVKAFDGTTYSNAVSVNMDVNGENDAPTVSVTTVSLIDRTESDFTVNSYYVLTEKEVYDLMGVSDVDSKDGLSLSLVADSGVFELDGKNVNSENNGIIQLTAEDIEDFGLTGKANVGDFFVFSTEFESMSKTDVTKITFDVKAFDGTTYSNAVSVNMDVNGENDAPTVSVTTVSLIDRTESDFTVNSYYVLTEKEVYDLMGVSDVDSKDGLSLSLVADSGVFELDGKNVNSENNGIIQLTAEDIEDFGLTGKANVGDFFVFSTEFESMSKTDVTKITFDVKAFDGTTYSNAVSVNMDVNGENDAPTVSVTTVSLIDRTESDFTVNSYYVLTEKEVYDLMGVSDVDSKDGLSLSLVADSGVFELDGKNVNSENNGIIQLTAEDIEDFGLTGKANVGDFFVFSTEFESMSKTDVTKITFDVKAFDGTTYSNAVSVNMDVNGENDAPTVSVTTVSLIDRTESDFTVNSYYVLTEKEVYDLMGVSDVDSKDGLSLSLVADSGVFELDGKNVNSENNGIIQLTAEDIEDFGLTGKANVGDFFVFSTEFESMSKTDVTKITFDVKAFDGTTYSNAVSVNMDVNGENDAPTVSVTTVSLIDRTESDFTVNSYYVLTEKEVYDLMGVSDVDSKDGLSLSLVADSGVFELDGKNVNSENNGIIQLTAEDIEDFGLTGKANVGDFFVFSTEFESMSKTDVTKITFDVKAFDGTTYSNAVSVNMDVNGENDAPTAKDISIELIENQLINTSIDNTTLTVGVNSDKSLNNNITDSDVLDTHTFARSGTSLSLTFTTSSSGLVHSVQNNQIEYIRDVAAKFVSIPEIATVLASITNVNMLILIGQLQNASSVSQIAMILNSVGITPSITSAGLSLTIADASILETKGLLTIDLSANDGSYSLSSPLFNNLGVIDTVSLSFDYIVTDSGNKTDIGTVTVNIKGSNDAVMIENVTISTNEDALVNSTKLEIGIDSPYALTNFAHDIDVTDDFYFEKADGSKIGLTLLTTDPALLVAFQTNNVAYIKNVALQLLSIPEVAAALSTTISEPSILSLINSLNSATTVIELFTIINHINGISASMTTAGLSLSIEDVSILVDKGLLSINIAGEGSYTVESLLFNNMSINDSISLSFDYIAKDSGGATTDPRTITVNITGTNDAPTASSSSTIISSDSISYVGQLVANDVDVNDTLTYAYDNTSVSMTLSITGLNNLDSLLALNNPAVISALTQIKAVGLNFVATGNIANFMTLSPSTIATAKVMVSTLQDFLDSNSGLKNDIVALKDFISVNKASIIANTTLEAQDIVLLETLLTQTNITALENLFNTFETFISNPIIQTLIQNILADNVISGLELAALVPYQTQIQELRMEVGTLIAANPTLVPLLDISTIVSKLQEIVTVDTVNGEITTTVFIPSTIANLMVDLDVNSGEYTITNPYLGTLPDSTQVEINFNYTVTDSELATDSSTASILITSENVNKMSASLDDEGSLLIGDESIIDMASLLSNITSNINVADIDSIDLSNNEHILSNLTIIDFQEMVSDTSSNTLAIKGENDDIIKLDPTIWLKDTNDSDTNSVVDDSDDHFIAYKAIGTESQVLTLLIDKDIIVQDI